MARICMVAQSYYLRDPRVRREAEALAEYGHLVEVFCLRAPGEPSKESISNVKIKRLPLTRRRATKLRYIFEFIIFFLLSAFYVTVNFFKGKYDIVQVHTMPDFLVFCSLVPKIFGCRVLLDVHEPMPELYISKYKLSDESFTVKLLEMQERASLKFADHVLTVSEPMRNLLIQRGASEDKTSVVMNLPDTKYFKLRAKRNIHSPASSNGQFKILYCGTVAERYGLDIAVKGIWGLKEKIPEIKLIIAGDGEYVPALQKMVTNLSIDDFVEFKGPVRLEDVPNMILESAVGISTHQKDIFWDLYFSTKIVEFLTMGKPVVSSRTQTLEFYFDDNEIFFFTPENVDEFCERILDIYTQPFLAESKVRAGAKKLERNLNWHFEKQKYLNLFKYLEAVE